MQRKIRALKGRIILLVVILIIGIQIAVLMKPETKPKDELSALWSGNYKQERAYWKGQIDTLGTTEAYEAFKLDTKDKNFGISHTLAHVFGELIYEKEGIKGVAVCDSTFAFGCYHSFFGRAITENGVDVVKKLDQACIDKWGLKGLGCPHGIGHGVLGYLGDDRLDEALGICKTLSWQEPIGGCTSGVFMEFNFHTMQSLNGAENREFDPNNPHYPCNSVAEKFGQACYFEQPQWWSEILGKDYKKIGLYCSEVKERTQREACFRGLGNTIAPDSLYNATSTIASCKLMPDNESSLLCREGASWAFYAEPRVRNLAEALCSDLPDSTKRRCISGFDLAGDRI